MASKFEALREAFLTLLEEVYDEAQKKGVSIRALLKRIFGESSLMMIHSKLRNMKKEGKPFTEWSIKIEKIEEALNRLGYTIVPVVMPIDEKEEIEELEEITVKTLAKVGEKLEEILNELSTTKRTTTTKTAQNKVEPDNKFLMKLKQRLKAVQKEKEEETKQTVTAKDESDSNNAESDIFDL